LVFLSSQQDAANLADLVKLTADRVGFIASWLYQGQRQGGQQRPFADEAASIFEANRTPIDVKGLLPV
jgi:hypothetical protein